MNNIEQIIEENKTLRKKIKNMKRTKLKLKKNLNKIIVGLKSKIKKTEINSNWETINFENN